MLMAAQATSLHIIARKLLRLAHASARQTVQHVAAHIKASGANSWVKSGVTDQDTYVKAALTPVRFKPRLDQLGAPFRAQVDRRAFPDARLLAE